MVNWLRWMVLLHLLVLRRSNIAPVEIVYERHASEGDRGYTSLKLSLLTVVV
jgi:hypothetical protein